MLEMEDMLRKLGGYENSTALGLDENLIYESLQKAHLVRERCTLLYYYNTKVAKKS
ncbi:hypothetical protein ACM26V_14240 [Salipaludibacillus sp. HK11]|uniref:hypothetical protein n=1 Tax=Salipaludibacillus sp. HK11 TaxID=3394320 RepID=UPI0039FBAF14